MSNRVSCFCGCATCVCSAQVIGEPVVSTAEVSQITNTQQDVVADTQTAEFEKGENLPMSGDVSSTDVVSSGFSGWGSQASLKPAEVALIGTNNPFATSHVIRDSITHESLRAELKSVDAKVSAVQTSFAASEARQMQRELDQLRADKTNGLLEQILAKIATPAA